MVLFFQRRNYKIERSGKQNFDEDIQFFECFVVKEKRIFSYNHIQIVDMVKFMPRIDC